MIRFIVEGWSIGKGRSVSTVMRKLYAYHTEVGTFFIGEERRRYFVLLDERVIGSYASAEEAAAELSLGQRFDDSLPGVDVAALAIPLALTEWEIVR